MTSNKGAITEFRSESLFVPDAAGAQSGRPRSKQLRLGLGQVLHYQHVLAMGGRPVEAVLFVERAPADMDWIALCEDHGVKLVWPATLASLT